MRFIVRAGFALVITLSLGGCGLTWDVPGPKLAHADPSRSEPNDAAHCFVMERGGSQCEAR